MSCFVFGAVGLKWVNDCYEFEPELKSTEFDKSLPLSKIL